MKTISMKEYNSQKRDFYTKHSGERGAKERTDCIGGIITKEVIFEDGHTWNEVTTPHYFKSIYGITIKYYKTEIWDSENSLSRCFYEAA